MKKGFTLIELLTVIVILAIIALIAVPIVINIINAAKDSSKKESIKLYAKTIENAIANYNLRHPEDKNITVEELKKQSLVNYKGEKINCEVEEILPSGKVHLAGCSVGNEKINYEYGELQSKGPELVQGLIPVIYDGSNWKVVSKTDLNWYDYDNQKWANAVVLSQDAKTNHKDTVGSILTIDGVNPDILMMLVWIPRFEYNYKNLKTTLTNSQKQTPPAIDVNFISKDITTPSSKEYKIHPAFIFGTQQLSGIWVGKFELSSEGKNLTTQNNLNCSNDNCTNNISDLRVLPNKTSLKYNNVSNFFFAIRSIEKTNTFGLSNIDTHMMKNSEWGAVAYLSQSKYGKYGNNDYTGIYKEVYQNKSSSYITGSSNGTPSQSGTNTQCVYNDMTKLGTGKGVCGPGASTTGNIYGIYDMSGGSWEYVMGVYKESGKFYSGFSSATNSGFKGKYGNSGENTTGSEIPNSKYYDTYISTNITKACNNDICYGYALSETSNWYKDGQLMIMNTHPWFIRGGCQYNNNTDPGMFYYYCDSGGSSNYESARVVFVNK